ncbi:MAG TPA: phenylalanine--tRNA ligase subunit beta [Gaiellaceae bacterium]|nr:phenylalanine--tRNA ligase subunit beta [Gaiellaceae bacterium]
MLAPLSWLREYVHVTATARELADRLSVSSLEVERVLDVGPPDVDGNLGRFLVGHVVEAGKHPNADRLQLCRVDVGESEPRQIVCGAWNFGAGATVAVALPGALLPGAEEPLREAKLRGETSRGMILSERELTLGDDHSGILVLEPGAEPGTPLADVLPLREQVLDVTPTMNRVDLLSMVGLAREVAALLGGDFRPPEPVDPEVVDREEVDVQIEDLERCPRYIGRVFRDVRIGTSPAWLRARLHLGGMRAISNVVDITNYAMHVYGSPLHAFDRQRLAGGRIVVRRARAGEQLRALNDTLYTLDERDLLITDGEKAVALAAIMGGLESEVGEETTEVLLEAANFEPVGILETSERLALRTAGSNRWEKGVDPYLAEPAAVLASRMLVDLAAARMTGTADVHGGLPAPPVVTFRPERSNAVVGLEVDDAEQRGILQRLGFDVTPDWTVTVPTWRARDVTREIDLVEEVARVVLDRVPFTTPLRRQIAGHLTTDQRLRRVVEDALVGAGFSEAYTWSLQADDLDPGALRLPDPLSGDAAVLRTTLLDGLVGAVRVNLDAGNEDIALFELARVYLPSGEQLPEERWHVGGIVEGGFEPARAAVEMLHETLHVPLQARRATQPFLHPGKAAEADAGWFGELHPQALDGSWGAFELDLATLFARVPERIEYTDVITFPALTQDIAVAVDEDVEAGAIVAVAREAAGPELREARVFDVYRGEQVGEGRKSVAVHLAFQSPERTLSDEDAAELRGRIVAALAERLGAELRS